MLKSATFIIAVFISMESVLAAPRCVTDMRDFDYMETSPQEFMQGTPEQVRSGYRAMLALTGDVASVQQATQYFVDAETFSKVTARECDGELCRGQDLIQGHIQCAEETGAICSPLAAIKDGTLYCVLKPTYEYGAPEFQPFD